MSTPRRRRKDREPLNPVGEANLIESLAIEPAHEDIAVRAYQLYEERGGEQGRDWEDWFQAERELRQLARHRAAGKILATAGPFAVA